jgi:hypothetical protein
MGKSPARPEVDGRPVINRADIMELSGSGRSTAARWYALREENGHPEKAARIDRVDYWFEDDWLAWYAEYRRTLKAKVTAVDHSGDPDELVGAAEAARILNYSAPQVILSYLNNNPGYFPDPDAHDDTGRGGPMWRRRTVWKFGEDRQGPGYRGGRPKGVPGARKPHPYAGDPRLESTLRRMRKGEELTESALAADLRTSTRTAARILATARALLEEGSSSE